MKLVSGKARIQRGDCDLVASSYHAHCSLGDYEKKPRVLTLNKDVVGPSSANRALLATCRVHMGTMAMP